MHPWDRGRRPPISDSDREVSAAGSSSSDSSSHVGSLGAGVDHYGEERRGVSTGSRASQSTDSCYPAIGKVAPRDAWGGGRCQKDAAAAFAFPFGH